MFLTQIVNGQVTELALCEACAKAKGLFDPQSLTFAEKFFPDELKQHMERIIQEIGNKKGASKDALPLAVSPDMLTRCPSCQFTLEDLRRTGHLGCPDCYPVFAAEFDAEDSSTALGQGAPNAEADGQSPEAKRKKLERRLNEAIEREDYELAARLRDELKALDH